MSGEFPTAFEEATPKELEDVYNTVTVWLEQNGAFGVEPSNNVRGHIDGLPVMETPPSSTFQVNGEIIRHIAPDAAATLEIGEIIELVFNHPYYQIGEEEGPPLYQDPTLEVYIDKVSASSLEEESIIIGGDQAAEGQEPVWTTRRLRTERGRPGPAVPTTGLEDDGEIDALLDAHLSTQENLGLNRVSADECKALQEIADHLDDMLTAQLPKSS